MTRAPLALVVAVVCTAPAATYAQDVGTVLAQAERAYRTNATFRAAFYQTIVNPMLGDPEHSRGFLFLEPPNRFAMRFTDPEGDRIVADGTWLWIYAPSSVPNQVIKQPIPTSGAQTPNLVAQFVDRPLERYDATYVGADTVAGAVVDVVRLVPQTRELPFRRAEIAVDRRSGLLRRIVLAESSGQRRTLVFERVQTDGGIPAGELRFDVPRGARVVTP